MGVHGVHGVPSLRAWTALFAGACLAAPGVQAVAEACACLRAQGRRPRGPRCSRCSRSPSATVRPRLERACHCGNGRALMCTPNAWHAGGGTQTHARLLPWAGYEVGTIMLIYTMALAYGVSSPIILPLALIYFIVQLCALFLRLVRLL